MSALSMMALMTVMHVDSMMTFMTLMPEESMVALIIK
jgi:hypothetical protein